jgi:hypothetical protein
MEDRRGREGDKNGQCAEIGVPPAHQQSLTEDPQHQIVGVLDQRSQVRNQSTRSKGIKLAPGVDLAPSALAPLENSGRFSETVSNKRLPARHMFRSTKTEFSLKEKRDAICLADL